MSLKKKTKIYILDTSAILSGKPFDLNDIGILTTTGVKKEISPYGKDYFLFQVLIEKKLDIRSPTSASIEKIKKISQETGDLNRLSEVDKEILALALDVKKEGKKPVIITDDYSIQNIAHTIKIEYIGINQKGITGKFKWIYQCRGCGKKFKENTKICPVCGDKIKNIIYKKEIIKKSKRV
ncbi:MAG: nucleic acid-binding protein, partial [Candidatus Thermoplasmatota archaeon]|nr:nucleic acid-binding protein [Candidatus Thermoplasmatota archaeon]